MLSAAPVEKLGMISAHCHITLDHAQNFMVKLYLEPTTITPISTKLTSWLVENKDATSVSANTNVRTNRNKSKAKSRCALVTNKAASGFHNWIDDQEEHWLFSNSEGETAIFLSYEQEATASALATNSLLGSNFSS